MHLYKTSFYDKNNRMRYWYYHQCDLCSKEWKTTCFNKKKYIQNNQKIFCKACKSKITGKARRGKYIAWNKGKKYPELSRANSATWNGGTYISSDGYRMIYTGTGRTLKSGWESYKKEHILVMEKYLNRKLDSTKEVIHHIDGNKLNNKIENLWLCSHKLHKQAHNSMYQICYFLIQNKQLAFDTQKGIYYLV